MLFFIEKNSLILHDKKGERFWAVLKCPDLFPLRYHRTYGIFNKNIKSSYTDNKKRKYQVISDKASKVMCRVIVLLKTPKLKSTPKVSYMRFWKNFDPL